MKPKVYHLLTKHKMHPYRIMALVAINAVHLTTKIKPKDYEIPDGVNSKYSSRVCKKLAKIGIDITPTQFNELCGYLQNLQISDSTLGRDAEHVKNLTEKSIAGLNEILKDLVKDAPLSQKGDSL